MRLIDADHLKKWILQRWEKAYPTENLPTREVLEQIDREIAYEIVEEDIQKWIPCSERLPKERDSIFAKLYGTEKWRNAMFRRTSNTVIITVKFKDGTRQTAPCHTIDGEWNQSMKGMGKVLAWMPLPEPYKGEEE